MIEDKSNYGRLFWIAYWICDVYKALFFTGKRGHGDNRHSERSMKNDGWLQSFLSVVHKQFVLISS